MYIYVYHWYQKRCRCIRLYKLVVLDNHIRQKLIIDPGMYDCMTVHTCHWYCVYCVLHSQTQLWYTFVFMTCTVWLVAFFGWQVGQPAFDIQVWWWDIMFNDALRCVTSCSQYVWDTVCYRIWPALCFQTSFTPFDCQLQPLQNQEMHGRSIIHHFTALQCI